MACTLDTRFNYRLWFSTLLAKFFGLPFTISYVLLQRYRQQVVGLSSSYSTLVIIGFYVISIPAFWSVMIQYQRLMLAREVERKGAVRIPEVPSNWIGGLDLLLFCIRSQPEAYVVLEIDDWFEAVGADIVNARMLWQDCILTKNHRILQTVLATEFDNWGKSEDNSRAMFTMFGRGIFNTNGAEWKAHRALTRPFFGRERVTDFTNFNHFADKVIDIFRRRAEDCEAVDVQDIFGRFTLDAAGQFLFGSSKLNTLDSPSPRAGHAKLGAKGSAPEGDYGGFVRAFEELQIGILDRMDRGILWPVWELWEDKGKKHNKVIDEWIEPLLRVTQDNKQRRGPEKLEVEEGCLTDHLFDSTDDKQLIRDELVNILLASRDTTASLLSFTVYALAIHPEIFARLKQEIMEITPTGAPTYEAIKQLKYLRAVLNETLRLFPPVPLDERAASRPCLLPSSRPDGKPYYMPSGSPLQYSLLHMHRRKDLWGEDALDYNPERWINPDRLKAFTSDPFKFLPFNGGPRICLGQNFAYNEASFMMVRIMQEFESFELRQIHDAPQGSLPTAEMDWQKRGGRYITEKVWPRAAMTLYSKGGIWVKMCLASGVAAEG